MELHGRTAVVSGGASGIGYAITKKLAANGATVVIADIADSGEERASSLSSDGLRVKFVKTNLKSKEEIDRLADEVDRNYGGADILVNVAGIYPFVGLMDTTVELWDEVMAINLRGTFLCVQALVPQMIAKGKGVIINTGSSLSDGGIPNLFAYSISKGGVNTMTRNLASSLAEHHIRVNCVNPGWVLTEQEIAARAAAGQGKEWIEEQGKLVPLGRTQTGDDMASVVAFLVDDAASQITGQIINVDGGTAAINWHDTRRKS